MMKNRRLARHEPLIQKGPDLDEILQTLTDVIEVLNKMAFKVSGNLEQQSDKAMKQAFGKTFKKIGKTGGSEEYLRERPFQKAKDADIDLGVFE